MKKKVAVIKHEAKWAIQVNVEILLNTIWKTESVPVAKGLNYIWIGMKGLSNLVIACSSRNFFKKSIDSKLIVNHFVNKGCF